MYLPLSHFRGRRVRLSTSSLACLALTFAMISALAASAAAPAAADGPNANLFELSALANAMEGTVVGQGIPAAQKVDYGPFGASARVSSAGVVKADAGAPYSPFFYSLPGLVAGVTGGAIPVPTPPGYVAASYPTKPTDSQSQVGYEIRAITQAQAAHGESVVASAPGGAVTTGGRAVADSSANPDGSVSVHGESVVDGFGYSNVVQFAHVASVYSLTIQSSGKRVLKGSVDLGTITLLGAKSGLTGSGASLAGTPLPLTPETLNTLGPALAAQGITVTYAPQTFGYTDGTFESGTHPNPKKELQSVDFGGVVVNVVQNAPQAGVVGWSTTLGALHVSATNETLPSDVGSLPPPSNPTGGDATPPGSTGFASGPVQGGSSSIGGTPQVPTVDTPVGGSPEIASSSPGGTRVTAGRMAEREPSSLSFYLVLVLAGAIALVSSQLVRLLAVRGAFGGWRPASAP